MNMVSRKLFLGRKEKVGEMAAPSYHLKGYRGRTSRTYSRVNSPPYAEREVSMNMRVLMDLGELTARTRSNEVLPAFCNPIMVISISVALSSRKNSQRGPLRKLSM